MIAVLGSFRFPPEALEQARPLMRAVIAATREEPGCRAYAYAEDVAEPGLFRVVEQWDSREALAAHFATPHMQAWSEQRAALGFFDRRIAVHEIGQGEEL
ncbi:MAG TPA: putative quinol monooxygenase [Croceibacterium sp.]|nr:putative quinol monooxygenase [Croceibacterium sp.]